MYGQPQPMYGQQQGFGMQPGFAQPQPGFMQQGPTFQPAGPAFVQPGFAQPGFAQPQQGPTIIHINNDDDDGTPCQYCGSKTTHITRRTVGCTAVAWSICLIPTLALWWIPCCMDGCKDV